MRAHRSILTIAALLAGLVLPASETVAQTTPTASLTVEQRHVIKEVLKETNIPSASSDAPMTAGAKVPQDVSLNPMPRLIAQKVPQVKSHYFFVVGERVALVDPKDRTITEIIE
jgi:hypothetical protein